jgi:hypothetical protein
MVIYPISRPDADGRALINWIAEVTVDSPDGWTGERWFEAAEVSRFRRIISTPSATRGWTCPRSCRRATRPG